jgi:hypothetical protein
MNTKTKAAAAQHAPNESVLIKKPNVLSSQGLINANYRILTLLNTRETQRRYVTIYIIPAILIPPCRRLSIFPKGASP